MEPNTMGRSYPTSLVKTEGAVSFLSLAGTEAGRKAFLGNHEKVDSSAAIDVINAQIALRDGVDTIARLLKDETRTEVARNSAAQTVANKTISALQNSKTKIAERGNYLLLSAQDDAQAGFRLSPDRRFVQEQILAHIRIMAAKPDGVIELKKILIEDGEAAAVFANTKPYLLGMSKESHTGLYLKMIEKHLPEVHAKMESGAKLLELDTNYAKAITSVRNSFYNPGLAAKANTRVQL